MTTTQIPKEQLALSFVRAISKQNFVNGKVNLDTIRDAKPEELAQTINGLIAIIAMIVSDARGIVHENKIPSIHKDRPS